MARGISRMQAAGMAEVIRQHPEDDSLYGMKFDGTYWVVPVTTEQTAR
jgi:hypothetical protein